MVQKRIVVPTVDAGDWRRLLAKPDIHWQPGFSAMSTALAWERANGLPPEIGAVFTNADDVSLRDTQLAIAIPEYKVNLDGGLTASQSDVFCLLTSSSGLISMTVEGKSLEDFDDTLGIWKNRTSPQGVKARLGQIQTKIGLGQDIPDDVRYQLLHRAASAVLEAERFHAAHAVMLIQSFVADDNTNHFDDFRRFLRLYEREAIKDKLIHLRQVGRQQLYAAWVSSPPITP